MVDTTVGTMAENVLDMDAPERHPFPGIAVWLRSTLVKRATVCAMTSQDYDDWEFAVCSNIVRYAILLDPPVPAVPA